ncbi:cytochrome c oxidase assembly protein subunit 15 [Raineyella antarctica]|uniref:Cytochrome c oxidase assembly protein subunit 15 n=1 Tax=Raineyella antarctica TaxID=1577474 RepID=A0A1G6H7M8_9ACTN|nr:hypothetical protein [Raineyella antarctica]SDB90153.1 cytochrome c oxidase assembly protein subunit 15 [Raineyella antarctica]
MNDNPTPGSPTTGTGSTGTVTTGSATTTTYRAAAIITFAAVALGSLVCATDSSAACPNWPGCYVGQVLPGGGINPLIEFVHRVIAVSTGPLLLAAALLGLRLRHRTPGGRRIDPVVQVLPWIALAGALAAGIFGMMTIKWGLSKSQGAADLGGSLIAMVAMTTAAVARARTPRRTSLTVTGQFAWGAVALLWLVHVTGVFAAGKGSLTRCVSCPVWQVVDIDGPVWLQATRMVLAAVAIVMVAAAIVTGIRTEGIRWYAAVAAVLLVVELSIGLVIRQGGTTYPLSSVYAVSMVGLLWTTTLIAARSTFVRMPTADVAASPARDEQGARSL